MPDETALASALWTTKDAMMGEASFALKTCSKTQIAGSGTVFLDQSTGQALRTVWTA
jgi:hypothetical protein